MKKTNSYPIPGTDHFDLREFIDPITFNEFGADSIKKIDNRLFAIAEKVHQITGVAVTINNWLWGGRRHESGTRRQDTKTGAAHSAHKFNDTNPGKAIDFVVTGMSAVEVNKLIMEHEGEFYDLGVRQMEDISFTPNWTHLATRGDDREDRKIHIIKP